jgi:hypothetical protein
LYSNGNANGNYNVSLFWLQDPKAPSTGLTYELYRHKGTNVGDYVEWEVQPLTGVTIPKPDDVGLIQVTLSGANVPAYRQAWTYKVVAKVGGEEVDSAITTLNSAVWTPDLEDEIRTAGTSYAAVATLDTGRKIKIEVARVTSGLYGGDAIEFYAVATSLFNSTGQLTSSDQYLSQFTKIGEIAKADLENDTVAKRTITSSSAFNPGTYTVIAVLKNGNTRILGIQLSYYYYYSEYYSTWQSESNWSVTVTN